jgi:surface antigen
MRAFLLSLFIVPIFLLAACAGTGGKAVNPTYKPRVDHGSYFNTSAPEQCVSYARATSGIQIYGDAHTWWDKAKGKYKRGDKPKKEAVLVLSNDSRMKHGHLAVVKNIVNSRNIEVAHSNWGSDHKSRCVVYTAMPVTDVSPRNDWSQVRFWHYPSGGFGRVYKASGFIYK